MSLEGVLSILAERGLSIQVDPDGTPHLRGPKEEKTPALLEAVTAYRTEIVEKFRPKPRRQFLWRFGQKYTDPDDMPETWWPVGALWYRLEGEFEWKPIPGRPTCFELPEGEGDEKTTAAEP